MEKRKKPPETRVIEACEFAKQQEKPNFTAIARDFGIPYHTLRNRLRNGHGPANVPKLALRALKPSQEQALIEFIMEMRSSFMPVTPDMVMDWANDALKRDGSSHKVSRKWAYRFEKRLPNGLRLHRAPGCRHTSNCQHKAPILSNPTQPVTPDVHTAESRPSDTEPSPSPPTEVLQSSSVEETPPGEVAENQETVMTQHDRIESNHDAIASPSIRIEEAHHPEVMQEIAGLREQVAVLQRTVDRLREAQRKCQRKCQCKPGFKDKSSV